MKQQILRLKNQKMLKTKFAAVLLSAIAALGLTHSKTASQTRAAIRSQAKKSVGAVQTAPFKCRVQAYGFSFGGAAKTANVRVKPDKNAAILQTVTTTDETVYSISGSDGNGWFEIVKIEGVSDGETTLFAGRGWVHSSNLDLSVANSDPNLRAAADGKSRVVKKLIPDESEARPLACRGDWMEIKSGKTIGWLSREGQCANPLTTCS